MNMTGILGWNPPNYGTQVPPRPFTMALIQKETDMKNLMITTAASALVLGMAACSQASDDVQVSDATYGETQTAETTTGPDMTEPDMAEADRNLMDAEADMDTEASATVYLAETDLSAEELIGAKVTGVDGEDIATVDDLLINANGEIESVIFKSGDILDVTGKKGAIPYQQVDLTVTADQEPRFNVAMTEDAIQNVAEFEQDGLNDYRLASEMIGTTASFVNSDDDARIRDLIVGQDGSVQYAIVSDPLMIEEMRTLDFSRIQVEQGDGGPIVINASKADFKTMPRFAYEKEEASMGDQSEWDEGSDTGLMPELDNGSDTTATPPQ